MDKLNLIEQVTSWMLQNMRFEKRLQNIVVICLSVSIVVIVFAILIEFEDLMGLGTFALLSSFSIAFYFWKEFAEMESKKYHKIKNVIRISSMAMIICAIILFFILREIICGEYYIALLFLIAGLIILGLAWLMGTFRRNI
ncbi:MAG: hypothetical protein JSV56_05285 [Methanomassiliicoccales archaeon]|nr:MAG: hypothetical protein JSV56_05285 [Methanomassiliicoccales archaeon]